jgi:predicted small secreted protein
VKGVFIMKNKFILIGSIALLAVIGFSMAACNSNGGDGDDEVYGCTYSDSENIRITMAWGAEASVNHYLLTISYDQARAKIIEKLGPGEAGDPMMLQTGSRLTFNSTSVVLEVTKFSDSDSYKVILVQLPMGGKGHYWQTN